MQKAVATVVTACCLLAVLTTAAPWGEMLMKYRDTRVACGSQLADLLSLVCSGRGYYGGIQPALQPGFHRSERGIVDECCRNSCSYATLELYCQEVPVVPRSNEQIRKFSSSTTSSEDTTQFTTEHN